MRQLWTDTARGFLGEIEQDISTDKLIEEYISTDIKAVCTLDEYSATKVKNIDAFVSVRAGTAREHFVAFLKSVSFLQAKLFPMAEQLGELSQSQANNFGKQCLILSCTCIYFGFLMKRDLNMPIHSLGFLLKESENYRGKDTRRIEITHGVGILITQHILQHPHLKTSAGNIAMRIGGINSDIGDKDHSRMGRRISGLLYTRFELSMDNLIKFSHN